MPSYGVGAAATVVVTVRVCVGTSVVIAAVVVTTGGGGGGARLDVVGGGGRVEDIVVEASVVDVSPPPPPPPPPPPSRVAYTPSTVAAAASTPTADARIGTARDFRWGGAAVAALLRSCVGASGSAAPRLGDVAAARVGADAGMTCVVTASGRGFTISGNGIVPVG
jgi:hypothetical protein